MTIKIGEGHLLKDDLSNYSGDLRNKAQKYKTAANTVDVAICTIKEDTLQILLIKRKYPPFRDFYALPGGFVDIDAGETLEETAHREKIGRASCRERV